MIILPRKIVLSKNSSYGFRIIKKKKKKLSSYHSNDQDKIRRTYIQKKGHCQSFSHKFSQKNNDGVFINLILYD
jgi:hypothetical protein